MVKEQLHFIQQEIDKVKMQICGSGALQGSAARQWVEFISNRPKEPPTGESVLLY